MMNGEEPLVGFSENILLHSIYKIAFDPAQVQRVIDNYFEENIMSTTSKLKQ